MTKPKTTKSRYSVDQFGPELISVLIAGSKARIEIPCHNQRSMKFLQFRLHLLRRTMAQTDHAYAGVVARARVTCEHHEDTYKLIVQPHDAQFTELFRRAGIDTTIGHDLLEEFEPKRTPDSPSIEPPDDITDPYAKWKGGA